MARGGRREGTRAEEDLTPLRNGGHGFFLFLGNGRNGLQVFGLKYLIAVQAADVVDSIAPPKELGPDVRARLHKNTKDRSYFMDTTTLVKPPGTFSWAN